MACDFGFAPVEGDHFFISYNSEDADRIAPIVSEMNRCGVRLWYDRGLEFGALWESQIAVHIRNARAVIVFITKGMFAKADSYVHTEYNIACMYEKKILPVFLDRISPQSIPPRFAAFWSGVSRYHGINGWESANVQTITGQIFGALSIASEKRISGTRKTADTGHSQEAKVENNEPSGAGRSIIKPLITVAAVCAAIVAVAVISLLLSGIIGFGKTTLAHIPEPPIFETQSPINAQCYALVSEVRDSDFNIIINDLVEAQGDFTDYNFLMHYESRLNDIVPKDSVDPLTIKYRDCCYYVAYTEFLAKKYEDYVGSGPLAYIYTDDAERYRGHADTVWQMLNQVCGEQDMQEIIDYCRENNIISRKTDGE